jgi:hypothetical protein
MSPMWWEKFGVGIDAIEEKFVLTINILFIL